MRFAVLSLACGLALSLLICTGCERRNMARQPAGVSTSTLRTGHDKPGGANHSTEPKAVEKPVVQPAPADGLREVDGPELRAAIRAGKRKATLLNVWASWCGSCKRELPMLVDLSRALESEGVGVLFVSVDTKEARPAAAALLDTMSPKPESFILKGPLGPLMTAVNPRWKGALPATALYDEQGTLLWFWPGPVLEHEITTIVSQYLNGQPLEGPTLVEPDPPPG
jgi:thiol-disulfide isomerase/thioredoxin